MDRQPGWTLTLVIAATAAMLVIVLYAIHQAALG